MNHEPLLEDPTNRVVSVFDSSDDAEAAMKELTELDCTAGAAKLYQGDAAADQIDTSAKWFADTDAELRRYERELRAGSLVVSAAIKDADARVKVHEVLKQHNARLVTHFGEWVTEMMR